MLGLILGTTIPLTCLALAGIGYYRIDWVIKLCGFCYPGLEVLTTVPDEKHIILTIDDVPRASFPELLATLNQHGVTATFFLISNQVTTENRRYLVQAILDGHHLANHGHTDSLHARYNLEELLEEVSQCREMIRSLYQEAERPLPRHTYYRPGWGFVSNQIKKMVQDNGMTLALGSVYPHDPQIRGKKINELFLKQRTDPGDIVIVHDLPNTPEILDRVLPIWQEKAEVVSLDDYDRVHDREEA